MTVSTEVDHNEYTGNGVTTAFPYTFRIFQKSDLVVQVVDLNENITELILDTDYIVTGAGGYNGGNVILSKALANGYQISISRELPVTQDTDLRNHGKFFAEVHEDAFDKLTMLIQQVRSWFRLALCKPSSIANWYDALGNYIRNVRDPRDAQDAATKNYVDSLSAGDKSYTDSLFKRTLRVPEDHINLLPTIEQRANKVVGFDSQGNPAMLLPADGSANDVLLMIYNSWLHGMVGLTGGEVFPVEIDQSAEVGMQIPAGVRFIRVNGEIVCMSSPLGSPVIINSIDTTTVNNGQIELYPVAYFDKVMAGWKIAQNDSQLQRLLSVGGNLILSAQNYTLSGDFTVNSDLTIKSKWKNTKFTVNKFWLRTPLISSIRQPYDITIDGSIEWDFSQQSDNTAPNPSFAIITGGKCFLRDISMHGSWYSNAECNTGTELYAYNVYSYDAGLGKQSGGAGDAETRLGSGFVVKNFAKVFIDGFRGINTYQSTLFVYSDIANRTNTIDISRTEINGSGGNGIRVMGSDADHVGATRVVINNFIVKNCESHGIRCNFRLGVVNTGYIESCNAALAIEYSSDMLVSDIVASRCATGILCRYYPLEGTDKLTFSNIKISNPSVQAIFFSRNSGNTTNALGKIRFSDIEIDITDTNARAIDFSGKPSGASGNCDVTFSDISITGAWADTNRAFVEVTDCRHIKFAGVTFLSTQGTPSSYIKTGATTSVILKEVTALSHFGSAAVGRPFEILTGTETVNITGCVIPVTSNGNIAYSSSPIYRYESCNQFLNSSNNKTWALTNYTTQTRSVDAASNPALATLIADIASNNAITR